MILCEQHCLVNEGGRAEGRGDISAKSDTNILGDNL